MKKIILILFITPYLSFSQFSEFTFEFERGFFEDVLHSDLDENSFSSDLSSTFEGLKFNSLRFAVYYPIYNKFQLGVFYSDNKSSGANSVEYYETKFDEYGLNLEYDFYQLDDFTFFTDVFVSNINFNSSRYFLENKTFPISEISDDATALGYGFGANYNISKKVMLSFSYSLYSINNDGFDGWDYGTDIDKLIYRSFSIRFKP